MLPERGEVEAAHCKHQPRGEVEMSKEELYSKVREWHEGPAWNGVELPDFCEQNGIPIDESAPDRLTPETRKAMNHAAGVV